MKDRRHSIIYKKQHLEMNGMRIVTGWTLSLFLDHLSDVACKSSEAVRFQCL